MTNTSEVKWWQIPLFIVGWIIAIAVLVFAWPLLIIGIFGWGIHSHIQTEKTLNLLFEQARKTAEN